MRQPWVSISPWANEEFMGERLRGMRIIYHRKLSATYLGVSGLLDKDAVREHIRKSLLAARGCKMEITQRDVCILDHNPAKGKRYVRLIREEIDRYWRN